MRIHDVRVEDDGVGVRLAAIVTFEIVDRAPVEVHINYPSTPGARVEPRAEPFLATAAVVADMLGEARLSVDIPVDPRLVSNVSNALALQRSWWPVDRPRLTWSTTDRMPAPGPMRTAFCMTGGIDSTSLLVQNHARYPEGHPYRIDTGLVVYGLDASTEGDILAPDHFLEAIAERHQLAIAAVHTNLRDLEPSVAAWQDRIQVAVLSGAGHAVLTSSSDLLVAPSDSTGVIRALGTQPALDHYFGSTELRVHYENPGGMRLERLRLLCQEPELWPFLQVCNKPRADWGVDSINCGRCEKCARTLVGFRAVGIETVGSFAASLTPGDIDAMPAFRHAVDADVTWSPEVYWLEYIEPLREQGEHDLAAAVERLVSRIRLHERVRRLRRIGRRIRRR